MGGGGGCMGGVTAVMTLKNKLMHGIEMTSPGGLAPLV